MITCDTCKHMTENKEGGHCRMFNEAPTSGICFSHTDRMPARCGTVAQAMVTLATPEPAPGTVTRLVFLAPWIGFSLPR